MLELKFAEFPQRKEVHGLFMYPPQTQHADFLCAAAAAAAAARIRRCKRFSHGKCLSHKIFKKKKKKMENKKTSVVQQGKESQATNEQKLPGSS